MIGTKLRELIKRRKLANARPAGSRLPGTSTKPCFPAKMGAMGIRLATWNVNSLRQRLDHLARFAAEAAPDLICLQETKVVDDLFPRAALHAMGYPHLLVHGH